MVMVLLKALGLPSGIMLTWPGVLLVLRQLLVFQLVSKWRDGASAEQYSKNHWDAHSPVLSRDETSRVDSKGYIPTHLSWIECCRCRNPVCGWGWSNVRRPNNSEVIDLKARASCWVFNHYFSLKYVLDLQCSQDEWETTCCR